jgi:hypothetical protein
MTLTAIAAALGIPTPAELSQELGIPEAELRPAELPGPCLVLDYRALQSEDRWGHLAKPPLPEIRKALRLDSVTGLRTEEA